MKITECIEKNMPIKTTAVLQMRLEKGIFTDNFLLIRQHSNKFIYRIKDHLGEIFLFIQIGHQDSNIIGYLIFTKPFIFIKISR